MKLRYSLDMQGKQCMQYLQYDEFLVAYGVHGRLRLVRESKLYSIKRGDFLD
jgi:hypothetical protein